MAVGIVRFGKGHSRRPSGLCLKSTLVVLFGLCFIFVGSIFFSSSVPERRSSFSDIPSENPIRSSSSSLAAGLAGKNGAVSPNVSLPRAPSYSSEGTPLGHGKEDENKSVRKGETKTGEQEDGRRTEGKDGGDIHLTTFNTSSAEKELPHEEEIDDSAEAEQIKLAEGEENQQQQKMKKKKRKKHSVPLFDDRVEYSWKLCNVRTKYNYVPCFDNENSGKRGQSYRLSERSCPARAPTCLVPLPEGYRYPIRWPESKSKIWYSNVAHPLLAKFMRHNRWFSLSGDYLMFPSNETHFKGGALSYIESIQEMAPDIDWGKNIHLMLDIGCTDASFGVSLFEKDVLTLSLELNDDLVDLGQVALERGVPAVVSALATKRLPFPSGVFDAVHCGSCGVHWHSNGGKLLLEMNRILRPGGYFLLSTKSEEIDPSEAMSVLIASICWNILAHKTDELSEMGVKIYQKPSSNDIYELRRKDIPLCDEEENPDAAWENFFADTEHWKAVVSKSYLDGLGVDWSSVRGIMDMKTIYGGLASALGSKEVWVMNVVPINAPDTLSIIFERGLVGIYHDWCEPFSTYPRSYDLLHADHLFSTLKNRCRALDVVVEMDRILRPGGWAIIREKIEILSPLEAMFHSLHWEIRMTYSQDNEGIMCLQKIMWRP
ncbi:putative methyltransferase [Nymphaea thermarum]|nr:putative methyltransferase [Nymphaea thermarum]